MSKEISKKEVLKASKAIDEMLIECILMACSIVFFAIFSDKNVTWTFLIVAIVCILTAIEFCRRVYKVNQIMTGNYSTRCETIERIRPRRIPVSGRPDMVIETCYNTMAVSKTIASEFCVGDKICMVFIGKEKYPSIIEKESVLI